MLYHWSTLPSAVQAGLARAHEEMCRALDVEMRARHHAPVSLPVGVRVRCEVERGAVRATYRFAMSAPREARVGDRVWLRFPSPSVPSLTIARSGATIAATTREFVVALDEDLGDATPAGGLYIPPDAVGLVEVQEHLRRIAAGETPFNARVALQLLGEHETAERLIRSSQPPVAPSDLMDRLDTLNEGQIEAVRSFLERDLAVLWGPPGTGKTTVIAQGVALRARQGALSSSSSASDELVARRPRILVVAPTNHAADAAIGRIARELSDARSARTGRVLRFGRHVTPALEASYGDQIVFDRAFERIRRERMRRAVAIAARYEDRLLELDEVATLLAIVPPECDDERVRLARRYRRLSWYAERFKPIVRQHVRIFEAAYRKPAALERKLLASCQVLGTTVHQALMSRRIREAHWDCIVIDETSMVPLALAYAIGVMAHDTLWVAGDPRQLGPVVEATTPHALRWLKRDAFTASRSVDDDPSGAVSIPDLVSRLAEQYRMHPDVCQLVAPAYGDALRTDRKVAAARRASGLQFPFRQPVSRPPQPGVYLLDVSNLSPAVRPARGGSRENPVHVAVVRALLEVLDAAGALSPVGGPPASIAIISPFAAQAQWLAKVIATRFPGRGIRCDTVHAFQGQEVDVLIIDLTESCGLPLTDWMTARAWSDEGARLLTTAISRCRERCVVIASCVHLYNELQMLAPRPIVYRLLRYLEEWGGAIEVNSDVVARALALRQRPPLPPPRHSNKKWPATR